MADRQPTKAEARAAKAAEMRAAQSQRERRRRILTIAGVIAVMVAIVGGAFLVSKLQKDKEESDIEAAVAPAGDGEHGVTIGPDDAPHEIVIYEDFLCPFCGQLERASSDELEELAADGKVQVEYRPFDLPSASFGDYPIRATNAFAVVLEEEGAEVAKEFHDLLFANQPEEGGDYPSDDELVDLAVEAGASEEAVRDGIEGLAMEDWVTDATKSAGDAGVTGTPTVLLDGELFTDYSDIDSLVNNLIEAVE
jgi:protein-disulfide isomerase